jgi:hypothetical protein
MKNSIKNTLLFAFFGFLAINNKPIDAATHITQPRVVIFLFEDLFKSDRMSMVSQLGWFNSMWNLTTALKSQHTMFKALIDKFGRQTGPVKAHDPQTREELPIPFTEWLLGKNPAQVCSDMKNGLNSYNFPDGNKERKFIFDVLDIIFDPSRMASTFGVVSDTLKLIERIATGPAHPRLILLANCNDQTFNKLKDLPEGKKGLRHFNNAYISGSEKLLVEDPQFYTNVINAQKVQASECVLITSNKHAANAAKSVGMQTVYSEKKLYDDGKDYCKSTHLIKR